MRRMLLHIPEAHYHSARELKKILLNDWPVMIEEYDETSGFSQERGNHKCSACDPEWENRNGME